MRGLLTCLLLPSALLSFSCAWSYIMLARRGMSIMAVGLTALTSSKKVDMSLRAKPSPQHVTRHAFNVLHRVLQPSFIWPGACALSG